jgi:hypothetical protein
LRTKARTDEKTTPSTTEAFTILQIGDSHTSADFFTGEVRRMLQTRYGQGGVGYMPAGLPRGFRSAILKVSASAGWTYKSLQSRGAKSSEFRFSGYDAVATESGETIKIEPHEPLEFDSIEIEALAQPGGGAIEVQVNGQVESHRDLQARVAQIALIKIAAPNPVATLQELLITTKNKGTVSLASISIYNDHSGLTYNSVGYSGATINILNKLDSAQFAAVLRRINPSIVVLSFGTNESASKALDLTSYKDKYERVIRDINSALPTAVIVIIGPPDFNQISSACPKPKRPGAVCQEAPAATLPTASSDHEAASAVGATAQNEARCVWYTPTKLEQVRDVQRKIAERHGLIYWNWGSIMPAECGAHKWFKASPPLKSANEFVAVLNPIIDRIRVGSDAVPHD